VGRWEQILHGGQADPIDVLRRAAGLHAVAGAGFRLCHLPWAATSSALRAPCRARDACECWPPPWDGSTRWPTTSWCWKAMCTARPADETAQSERRACRDVPCQSRRAANGQGLLGGRRSTSPQSHAQALENKRYLLPRRPYASDDTTSTRRWREAAISAVRAAAARPSAGTVVIQYCLTDWGGCIIR